MIDRMKKALLSVLPDADLSNVSENTSLQGDLGLNSLSTMLLALAIEDEFGIRFEDAVEFSTVGDVVNYLKKNGVQ